METRQEVRRLLQAAIEEDVNLQLRLVDEATSDEEKQHMLDGYPGNAPLEPALVFLASKAGQQLVLRSMLREHGPVRFAVASFDHYLGVSLPEIVREYSFIALDAGNLRHEVLVGPEIRFTKPLLRRPLLPDQPMNPTQCRKLQHTYQLLVLAQVSYRVCRRQGDQWVAISQQTLPDHVLVEHPLMVGTSFAPPCDEEGGYFIVRGDKSNSISERSIQLMERMQSNYAFVFQSQPGAYDLEVRSMRESKVRSTSTLYGSMQQSNYSWTINFRLPFVTCQIPLSYLLFALGVTADEFVGFLLRLGGAARRDPQSKYYTNCQLLRQVAELPEPEAFPTVLDLYHHLGLRGCPDTPVLQRAEHLEHILVFEFLPHLGEDGSLTTRRYKAHFLAIMVFRALTLHLEGQKHDDRDRKHFVRDEGPGYQLALLMRQAMRQWHKGIQVHLHRHAHEEGNTIGNLLRSQVMNTNLRRAIITGNWTIKLHAKVQNGVTLPVNRQNANATISFIRRSMKPINKEGKNAKPRMQPHDAYGIRCAAETPEGHAGGLINNITLFAFPRLAHPSENILRFCYEDGGVRSLEHPGPPHEHLVLVNGLLAGTVADPEALMALVRHRRRLAPGWIPRHISVFSRHGFVFLNTDPGEMLRPLFVLENLHKLPALWQELCNRTCEPAWLGFYAALLEAGCLEYVGPNETDHFRTATRPLEILSHPPGTFTHMEVHPYSMLGYSAALVCFLNHNQSPRIVLQAALGKQAIPQCAENLDVQLGGGHYEHLWYADTPLVQTLAEGVSPTARQGYGLNLFQVIGVHGGFNVEDGIVFNRRLFDLGYMVMDMFRVYCESNLTSGTDQMHFARPTLSTCHKMRDADYSGIDPTHGCMLPNSRITERSMVIGRVLETKGQKNQKRKPHFQFQDRSVQAGKDEAGALVADAMLLDEGNVQTIRLTTRKTLVPQIGDKFSSRHGQKGVACLIESPENLLHIPALGGMIPDILMTPHAITSRMTIAHMYEILLSMLCAEHYSIGDGTGFQTLTVEEVMEMLQEAGLSRKGTYEAYDGITGNCYETEVYSGFVYIQRLKQLVVSKIHHRAKGPVHPVTRQPLDGRAKDGGMRVGEMEKDTLITHGSAFLLRDRLFEQSDHALVPVCRHCGVIASLPRRDLAIVQRPTPCAVCGQDDTIVEVEVPYPWKLLTQECMGMNCLYRLVFEDSPTSPVAGLEIEWNK